MTIEQIYTGCLAEAAYYIESNGEVAIIDPLREVQPYIEKAAKNNAKIKYVFETHFHADFVSGHIDLAAKTGADIVFGPTDMDLGFKAIIAKDQEEFQIGDIKLKVLHTPGHTLESSCYLLIDENGKETALFSGDTLFIGDVGRPDLAQKVVEDLSQEKLAGYLFDSLRNKILPLDDDITVYPAHGAGSACGKNMSKETTDTLGNQKKTNYALRADMTKEEFIQEVITGLTPPPKYFPQNVMMNIKGYDSLDQVMSKGTTALNPEEFELLANETRALLLDTRAPQTFKDAFVPNSINIGIKGGFAPWVGAMIKDVKQAILIIADEGMEEEVITRLSRVGFDNSLGFLKGGIAAWKAAGKEVDSIESVSPDFLANKIANGEEVHIMDVRKDGEFKSEHIVGAKHVALDYINENMAAVDKDKTWYVHCQGGYRSMIFTSLMRARGYENLIDVKGGFKAMSANDKLEKTAFVCPSTL